jgi:hypothetical protein
MARNRDIFNAINNVPNRNAVSRPNIGRKPQPGTTREGYDPGFTVGYSGDQVGPIAPGEQQAAPGDMSAGQQWLDQFGYSLGSGAWDGSQGGYEFQPGNMNEMYDMYQNYVDSQAGYESALAQWEWMAGNYGWDTEFDQGLYDASWMEGQGPASSYATQWDLYQDALDQWNTAQEWGSQNAYDWWMTNVIGQSSGNVGIDQGQSPGQDTGGGASGGWGDVGDESLFGQGWGETEYNTGEIDPNWNQWGNDCLAAYQASGAADDYDTWANLYCGDF